MTLTCIAVAVALLLEGCGSGSSDSEMTRAEAQVTAKQRALTDAESAFIAASTAFCESARSYVVSVDRYGDVLNATAPTVGDVRDAGEDLTGPREDAMAAAEKAIEANQAVVDAQNDLADAQAALDRATMSSGATGSPGSAAVSPSHATAAPLVGTATVNRVKAAESEFEAAVNGVTNQTPLTRASQEFNAAAVALEMSWLRLFADAGCLTDPQQEQAEAAVADYTAALQQALAQAGYYDGAVDGVYGPATVDGVKALQQAHGLPVTGSVDKATQSALQGDLQKVGGAAAQEAVASAAAVQQTLKLAGFWDGPVDGNWTTALTAALKEFQKHLGVKPTGTVDAATVAALENAIVSASPVPPSDPTGSPSDSPSASTTASVSG
jgi:murein L,D-transpeptidase YcbB/YkuD